MNKRTSHIIWCTYETFPVWDNRGNWSRLKECYEELKTKEVDFELNKKFPVEYRSIKSSKDQVRIKVEDFEFVKNQIIQLTSQNGDRVAGDLKTTFLNINETFIELIVEENESNLNQKLSRLKSRLATLMNFEKPNIYPGKKTWGKGIWTSNLNSKISEAIEIIKTTANTGYTQCGV